jgi:hypothetical protein
MFYFNRQTADRQAAGAALAGDAKFWWESGLQNR